jgi:transcriptional regulator with XRE-family HTH domain
MQGLILMELREDTGAQGVVRARAFALDPNNAEVMNNYGWFLCTRADTTRGLELLNRAANDPLYPTPEKAYLSAGLCMRRANQLGEAERYFRRALAIRPDLIGALYNLAEVTYERGEAKDAEAFLNRYHARVAADARVARAGREDRALNSDRAPRTASCSSCAAASPTRPRRRSSREAPSVNAAADAPATRLAARRGARPRSASARNLSRADIAQRLRMSVSQVEALELGDYARLPRGTFLRGFVRNYARSWAWIRKRCFAPSARMRPSTRARHRGREPEHPLRSDRPAPVDPYVKAAGSPPSRWSIAFAAMYWWLFVRPAAATPRRRKSTVVVEARSRPRRARSPVRRRCAPIRRRRSRRRSPRKPGTRETGTPEIGTREIGTAEGGSCRSRPRNPRPRRVRTLRGAGLVVYHAGGRCRRGARRRRQRDPPPVQGSSWSRSRTAACKLLLSRVNPAGSVAEVVGKGPFSRRGRQRPPTSR